MACEQDDIFETVLPCVLEFFDDEQHEKALAACRDALKLHPDEPALQRCHIFALASLNRWREGLQACDSYAAKDTNSFAFERAYCLYRLNRFTDALAAVLEAGSVSEDGRNEKLEAQIRYRIGDYSGCAGLYERMHRADASDPQPLINAVASHVSGGASEKALKLMAGKADLLESSSELCFNLACALIDEGQFQDAEQRLSEAKELMKGELLEADEELVDEDLDDHEEMAAIEVQRACLLQHRGNAADEEAVGDLYRRATRATGKLRDIDVTVQAVACNNLAAMGAGRPLLDMLQRVSVGSTESLAHKLTRRQAADLTVNKCLALMEDKRNGEARAEVDKLERMFANTSEASIMKAAVLALKEDTEARGGKSKQGRNRKDVEGKDRKDVEVKKSLAKSGAAETAESALKARVAANPEDTDALTGLAGLLARRQRVADATALLEGLQPASRVQPQVAEVLAGFYYKQGDNARAAACLREAMAHWRRPGYGGEAAFSRILRAARTLAERWGDQALNAEAQQLYLEVVDGSDNSALCGLVNSLACVDPDRACEYAQRLQVPSYSHFDAEELEMQDPPVNRAAADMRAKRKAQREPKVCSEEKANTQRQDAGSSDRHVPKRDRMMQKNKDKNYVKGSQGVTATDDSAFRKSGPSTAHIEVSADGATGRRTKAKKGKK